MTNYINIQPDKNALGQKAAEYWITQYEATTKNKADFHVALSGGTTPKLLYQFLSSDQCVHRVNWQRVHIYFSDERFLPHDHVDSNYRMAKEALLDKVGIPKENIHPVDYRENQVENCAQEYQKTIEANVKTVSSGIPQFDLVLLGMGDDGHTASLFPDTGILAETQRWVVEVYVPKFDSWRVSMTYPLINNAKQICVLVTGENKAGIMLSVLTQSGEIKYPIQGVHAADDLVWMLDDSAATELLKHGIPLNLSKLP